MVATDLVRAAMHGLLAALIFTGAVEVWHIVVIEAVFGAAEAFFRPAFTGLVPQTVPEPMLQDANAATSVVQTVAEFAGPALATALVLGVGAGWRSRSTRRHSSCPPRSWRGCARGRAASTGRRHPARRVARRLGRVPRPSLGVGDGRDLQRHAPRASRPTSVLGPTVAEEVYGSRGSTALLAAALGLGTIAGALIGFRWRPERPLLAACVVNLAWPPAIALFAVGAPRGVLAGCSWPPAPASRCSRSGGRRRSAQRIPLHALSRVSSYDWMGSLALLPFGYLLAGPLGEALGSVEVVVAGGAIALAVALLGFAIPDVWRLRGLEARVGSARKCAAR